MRYFAWHEQRGYWADVVRHFRAARLPLVRRNVWIVARRGA